MSLEAISKVELKFTQEGISFTLIIVIVVIILVLIVIAYMLLRKKPEVGVQPAVQPVSGAYPPVAPSAPMTPAVVQPQTGYYQSGLGPGSNRS